MVHFDKPCSLDRLQDLIQKIDQRYWEQKGELSQEISLAPKQDPKNNRSNKSSMNPHQNQVGPSNSHSNPNSNSNSKEKEKPRSQYFTANSDKLGKDGKLTPQECQCRFDNKLCLVCSQDGHIVTACPKAKPCAVKASLGRPVRHPLSSQRRPLRQKIGEQPSGSHAFRGLH